MGDPASYSRPDLAVITNLVISLDIQFKRKVLTGRVDLKIKKISPGVREVILDVDNLRIFSVEETNTREKLVYYESEPKDKYGSSLEITLPLMTQECEVTINYETSPDAKGLVWVEPEQTLGKEKPLLFSQFQCISARSVIPCQNTPAVKHRYSAFISCPPEMTVLMSAMYESKKLTVLGMFYHFVQDVPMPSYLIAVAVGCFVTRKIGPRSRVWGEEEAIEVAQREFGDTEAYLDIAEEICGPYIWGIYDILVLPPNFPYGGMGNPTMTFVHPLFVVGDRSAVATIFHEIAHSWAGNQVTCRSFDHVWLNEGLATFIQYKIMGEIQGVEERDFHACQDYINLKDAIINSKEKKCTSLVFNTRGGIFECEGIGSIAMRKGCVLLYYLEELVGGPKYFEQFLKYYFKVFKCESVDSDDFRRCFCIFFEKHPRLEEIDWENWFYGTGLPPIEPKFDWTRMTQCDHVFQDILSALPSAAPRTRELTYWQQLHVMKKLKEIENLTKQTLDYVREVFEVESSKSVPLRLYFYEMCARARVEGIADEALTLAMENPTWKIVSLIKELYDWEATREKTVQMYSIHRSEVMPTIRGEIEKFLKCELPQLETFSRREKTEICTIRKVSEGTQTQEPFGTVRSIGDCLQKDWL